MFRMIKEIVKYMKKILSIVNIIWFLENLLILEYYIEDRMIYLIVVLMIIIKGRKSVFLYCLCVCLVLFVLILIRNMFVVLCIGVCFRFYIVCKG